MAVVSVRANTPPFVPDNLLGQFAFYYPKIFKHYSTNLRKLFDRHSYLTHNFQNSIFPACTFNCSNTVTLEHTDDANYWAGICPIHSGGNYNPKLGGHIVLFSLKLVIEFPPGSSMLVPSSILPHGNTPIQPGETRVSFTQYCAGGLLRWVEYGFRTIKNCALRKPKLKEKLDNGAETRCRKALNRFSKLSELHNDRIKVFKL